MNQQDTESGSPETEGQRAEEALGSFREFSDSIVEIIREGLVAFDRDFRITFWNNAMEKTWEYDAEEVLGKSAFDILSFLTQEGVGEHLRAVLDGETIELPNICCQSKKGKNIYANQKLLPLRGEGGEIVGILAVMEDVTAVHQLERQVARLQEELVSRKLIEVAKGILMRELRLSEANSYTLIQKKSRDENKEMREVARRVIDLLGSAKERKKFG